MFDGSVSGPLDSLMAFTERHFHFSAWRIVGQIFQSGNHLVLIGSLISVGGLSLFISGFHAKDRLHHFIGRISWKKGIPIIVSIAEPAIELIIRGKNAMRSAAADNRPVWNLAGQSKHGRLTCRKDNGALVEQTSRPCLQNKSFQVASPEAGMDHFGFAGKQRGDFGTILS